MKLFNWIFAKPKKQEPIQPKPIQPTYVFKSWQVSAISYNRKHGLPDDAI